jgi:hypothetical protein
MRRRAVLARRRLRARAVDRVVCALRRLQSFRLRAYRANDAIVVSEGFNAVATPLRRCPAARAQQLLHELYGGAGLPPPTIARAVGAFGMLAVRAAAAANVRIAIVPEGSRYADFSPAIAALVPGIDDWTSPPSGLFVVQERRVLLRARMLAMTAAHEFAHALDAVLAERPRSYFSYESEMLRSFFAGASGFVNEYAASALDEYFAESVRAYLEVNDPHCTWLPVTRKDLFDCDPRMFAFIEALLTGADGRLEAAASRHSLEAARAPRTLIGSM